MENVHEQRFFTLIKNDNTEKGDVERFQLFYTIARTDELWNVVGKIYDTNSHSLKTGWRDASYGTFSKMLQRAAHLYNQNNEDIDTVKLFWGMDDYNSQTMINAQMIYCGLWNWESDME